MLTLPSRNLAGHDVHQFLKVPGRALGRATTVESWTG
jgi:hypothetical protein